MQIFLDIFYRFFYNIILSKNASLSMKGVG